MCIKTIACERLLYVYVGDGTPEGTAQMSVPKLNWLWSLRYGEDTSAPTECDDRMLAAGALESYRYLIMECTKEEAWLRIKQMRAAIREHDKTESNYPTARKR